MREHYYILTSGFCMSAHECRAGQSLAQAIANPLRCVPVEDSPWGASSVPGTESPACQPATGSARNRSGRDAGTLQGQWEQAVRPCHQASHDRPPGKTGIKRQRLTVFGTVLTPSLV